MSRPTSFAEQLRVLRMKAGLTQEELAERAGLTANAVSALERGERRRPYPNTVRALVAALGLDAAQGATLASTVQRVTAARAAAATPRARWVRLPQPRTPLLGRDVEATSGSQFLEGGGRLLTLTGPGGVGKTRLAIEIGRRTEPAFADGLAFVDLTPMADPRLVPAAIAAALGTIVQAGEAPEAALLEALGSRRLLLMLDNFEQVIEAAGLVSDILAACPNVRCVVTSRTALRVQGEQELPVAPLAVPELRRLPSVAEASQSAAVQLFVARAQAVQPSFELSPTNTAAVVAICRRVDGLPLAIELAAARTRVLAPGALLARMDTVLPLLVAGARDLPDRQQTMQRAIAWSYALLDSGDQSFLRHLAIFAGGWTIDAAASLSGLDETALLERLQSLVEKNLVRAEPGEDEPRFHMLQTIREYALGEWDPDALLAVRDRHADYFVQVAARLEPAWRVQQGLDAVREMEREHDNLRAALRWLVERRDTARASELVWLLWRFWWNRNHYTEGERWAEAVLGVLDATTPDRDRGRLLLVSSIMVYAQGFYSRAGARADEALCALRRTGDRWALATALHMRAWIALSWTEPLDADALLLEALDLYRDLDESWGIASVLGLLGGRALAGGDRGLARARYAEAAEVFSAHGSHRSQAYWQTQSALVELLDGRVLEAERLLLHSLSVIGTRVPSASVACLEGLAAVAARKGCSARAATLFGAIHAARAALSYAPMLPVTRDVFDSFLASARTHTSEQTWTSAWAAGLDMSLEEAVRFAESETE